MDPDALTAGSPAEIARGASLAYVIQQFRSGTLYIHCNTSLLSYSAVHELHFLQTVSGNGRVPRIPRSAGSEGRTDPARARQRSMRTAHRSQGIFPRAEIPIQRTGKPIFRSGCTRALRLYGQNQK